MDNRNQPPFSQQQPPQRPNRPKTGRLQPPGGPPPQQRPPQGQRPPQQRPPQQRPPQQQQQPAGPRSSLESSDSIQVSGQAGPVRKDPPPVISRQMENDMFLPPGVAAIKDLEDGAKIVRYKQPQKLGKLLKDAKAAIGGESSRFYGKGWVIGNGIAKIASDGTSIIYYPDEVSELVRDLLGPDSETI